MLKTVLCLVPAFGLALLAGPLAFLMASLGKPDPNDLYLVFDLGARGSASADIEAANARGVGPERGLLAVMINAPPSAFQKLIKAGYMLLPAGQFVTLCGYAPTKSPSLIGNF